MSAPGSGGRLRAYMQFIVAVIYFFLARALAHRGALGLAGDQWFPLVEQALLVFLLMLGYSAMGFWMDRQAHPVAAQGFPQRRGWPREVGMGLALGWALALACVLFITFAGGIAVSISTRLSSWGWLLADAAFFALAALAEEVAFRGYGFQRFSNAVGPIGTSLGFSAFYAIVQAMIPGASHASVFVSLMLGLVLSTAYVRTQALWLSWGINFGWKASRALIFGLTVSSINSHSPVVQGNPMGPFWATGGGYGLDGSWTAFAVLLLALPVVLVVTRDLNFLYNVPVVIPGGIAVDLDAAARAQHEAAMGPAQPAVPTLVQILPASTPPAPMPDLPRSNRPFGPQ